MKWFKHISASRNDERIAALEDKCGLEGYGFFWRMLEIVAEQMNVEGKCELKYTQNRWARHANISTKKWLYLLQCCSDVGLMSFQRESDEVVVKIPNLLKYRDTYTKNLSVADKQEVEVDKLTTTTTKTNSPEVALTGVITPTPERPPENATRQGGLCRTLRGIGIDAAPHLAAWGEILPAYSDEEIVSAATKARDGNPGKRIHLNYLVPILRDRATLRAPPRAADDRSNDRKRASAALTGRTLETNDHDRHSRIIDITPSPTTLALGVG